MFIMISTKSFGNITLKKLNFGEVETPYCIQCSCIFTVYNVIFRFTVFIYLIIMHNYYADLFNYYAQYYCMFIVVFRFHGSTTAYFNQVPLVSICIIHGGQYM